MAEKEEQQKREIANIKAREEAATLKVAEEERLKSETARIATEEKVKVAEENMQRQIIVAEKNKQRTDIKIECNIIFYLDVRSSGIDIHIHRSRSRSPMIHDPNTLT